MAEIISLTNREKKQQSCQGANGLITRKKQINSWQETL